MRLLNVLLCARIAALRPTVRAALPSSSSPRALPVATSSPKLSRPRATGAAAALAFVPAAAFAAATTEAELDDYFSTPHPEFAVALIIHWILWGKFDRRVALAYDFGGLVLFAAEPFFR